MITEDVIKKTVRVRYKDGLHSRMAIRFLQIANSARKDTQVFVSKLDSNLKKVTAKSLLGILSLGACQGEKIVIEAYGFDAEQIVNTLAELVQQEKLETPLPKTENVETAEPKE